MASGVFGRSLKVVQSEELQVTHEVPKKRSRRAADVGSSRKPKKQRNFINLVDEVVDQDEHVSLGVERKVLEFLDGDD